jgi:acetyl-CoA carboxylase, biotin carboxylase subunit
MKILVSNRGEIALRILRACRELGYASVAVYSEADRDALPVRYADESICIGPASAAESYLNIAAVLDAAHQTGADAIHPGYGFLSENAAFARAVEAAGMLFVGPTPETIALTGDKLAARKAARDAGLPVLQGLDVPVDEQNPIELAAQVTFPVLIKAVSGGGGRGIRLARTADEMAEMVASARQEARAAFGDDSVYLEPLVQRARHVEVQILGDGKGTIYCLGERECSIQRRLQKLIEESPAPGLSKKLRTALFESAAALARSLNYRSLGTVEFLLGQDGSFYFIEVNPRIQVEHPVTEMVTGLDLVRLQLQLAVEGTVTMDLRQAAQRGWAIEARVLAEEPITIPGGKVEFMPATGDITYLQFPGGPGIRVDSALYQGMAVGANYDSLIAKVIAWGEDRPSAIQRLQRALGECQIGGVPTNLEFMDKIIDSDVFRVGRADTTYLDSFQPEPSNDEDTLGREAAVATAILAHQQRNGANNRASSGSRPSSAESAWRVAAWREQMTGK